MAHGLNSVLKRSVTVVASAKTEGKTGIGSRRIFAPLFKLQVLDSYRNDGDCKGNQRATARKYGIHRRQIQKWLQVENTLRSSVGNKGKLECSENKQQDLNKSVALNGSRPRDDVVGEARVPCVSPQVAPPAPLDFTTHSRDYTSPCVAKLSSPPIPVDPAAPIDLSLKKPTAGAWSAPATYRPVAPPPLPSPPSLAQPHPDPDVWDLSTKNLKRKFEQTLLPTTAAAAASPPDHKPVKLFKPYLDDVHEPLATVKSEPTSPTNTIKTETERITPPACCSSIILTHHNCDNFYYQNNNVCDMKSEYTSTYTLTELQPKSYYYPCPNIYQTNDYELQNYYDDSTAYIQGVTPLKQRQSYSLDFKLSAIDCYYQDSVCKGNQRAVATKYNIHRRQVQKWLKQAEELRLRNESIKQMHAVR